VLYIKSIISKPPFIYLFAIAVSFVVSALFTPVMRFIAIKFQILDHPHTDIKTHQTPTPYLGGLAIWLGWIVSLSVIRFFTHFPTGTLRNLRGMLWGTIFIIIVGLIDDILPRGLEFKKKFLLQFIAAGCLIFFDIRIHFVNPDFMAVALSAVWAVGITNSFNIIDIMDGLSSGIALIASIAFLVIALPSEQIYVNFASAALAGACLGFLPYNLSKRFKIFMGDTGSLTIGFILAAISMGTSYTKFNNAGLLAPLLILAIPIYDTLLVSYLRVRRGQSPFLGSKDHFALRLEFMGINRPRILTTTYFASALLSYGAYFATKLPPTEATILLLVFLTLALIISYFLGKVEIG